MSSPPRYPNLIKTGDPWLLPPYIEKGTCIFVVFMVHTMTVRKSFKQPTWQLQTKYYTNNTRHKEPNKNIIQKTRVYNWSFEV